MKILAIDSSAKPASVAILEDNRILGEYFINTTQTHSETLMPMVESVLNATKTSIDDLDALAVTNGPGSFTGVRIGVSCVKGLAFQNDIKCCGVSTLEAIAYPALGYEGHRICAVMDARCNQVYNANFEVKNNTLIRLCDDRAVSIDSLKEEAKELGSKFLLIGDGAEICYEVLKEYGVSLASENIRFQRASSAALIAKAMLERDENITHELLIPTYLRIPQAERELKKKT